MVFQDDEMPEHDKTEVLYGNDVIIKKTLEAYSWINASLDGSLDNTGPAIMVLYEPIWTSLISLKKRGIKIRGVTEVTVDNIHHCKKLIEVGEFRHLDGIRTNFGIVDGKQVMLHGVSQENAPLSQAIVTSVKGLVEAQQYMFENLWNKAIQIEDKIKEIEHGIKPEIIETVTDPVKTQNLYLNMIKSSRDEILLIIPTINTMHHQDDIGALQLLKEITADNDNNNTNVKVRILISINEYYDLKEPKLQNPLLYLPLSPSSHIHLRTLKVDLTTKSTIIIVDKKESLVIEVKDDSKDTFSKSVGFATYSNSRATVLSYVSIFESFWKQSELVKKLKESEELQKDFIHIAAHELKNPIQPILSSSTILKSKIKDKESCEILEVINRNAKKLKQLTSDILDVTKIETKNFNLNKELFDLNEAISNIIKDFKNQVNNKNVTLSYNISNNYYDLGTIINGKGEGCKTDNINNIMQSLLIFADNNRITQVILNLLNNAIRFTEQGKIVIEAKKMESDQEIIIDVKDTGRGIDSEILPRLFTKFASKSDKGTGLGLYISKNIIEAHGGKMWAKNNKNNKGSTFSFSIPVNNQ